MAWSDEILGPDVASAGLHVSDYICRDASWILDLEEGLEASRYTSHPYSSHPKEVSINACENHGFDWVLGSRSQR